MLLVVLRCLTNQRHMWSCRLTPESIPPQEARQSVRQSVSQPTTDAGADDLKALAAKLKKKHRSGGTAQQQQSNGHHGDAAAFLAGKGRSAVPNGLDKGVSGEQPQKKRKTAKASQDGASPEKGTRKEANDGSEAALTVATDGKEKKVGKKRKLKVADHKAAAAQDGELQQADAGLEQITADLHRTKKKKAKRTSVTDVN